MLRLVEAFPEQNHLCKMVQCCFREQCRYVAGPVIAAFSSGSASP
jgi:hypothetical protein